jgi:3'-phosphoadenosine 5'-phosphosulfate sulfotransferase (PAPS reductase)/FAD synthetase
MSTLSLFEPSRDAGPNAPLVHLALAEDPTPDLASYDVIELSSSGGKDSLAMTSHVAGLLREAGLLERGVVVHADLGRVEWPGTPELVAAQAAHFGLRCVRVKRAAGDLLEHVEAYGKWPTPTTRYCTADLKRGPIYTAFTALAAEVRAARTIEGPVRILNCVGLRAEESPGRAKRPNVSRDPKPSGKGTVKIVDTWLPIQHWPEARVWSVGRASGAPVHPAYAAGFPRASCIFCIYAPEDALRLAGLLHPSLLDEYVRVERTIGHDFKHHLPLAKVQADLAAGARPRGAITGWCM